MTSIRRLRHEAVFNLFIGDLLGEGTGRKVYEALHDPQVVIKIETTAHSFQNLREWDAWCAVEHTEFAKWFAPCISIGRDGWGLLQVRCRSLGPDDKLPDSMPAFFSDFKRSNFGWLKGKFVAMDYGSNLMGIVGLTKRMRKPDWREY